MLVQRRPRAQIVPAEIGGDAVESRLALTLRRAGLEHRVIHADVLALRIQAREGPREAALRCRSRAPRSGDFFQHARGLGQVLAQRVGERLGAPDKYAAIPEKVA